jgi:hypothetical protein
MPTPGSSYPQLAHTDTITALAFTPDGYYIASPKGEKYLNVCMANGITSIDSNRAFFNRPEVVVARLEGN